MTTANVQLNDMPTERTHPPGPPLFLEILRDDNTAALTIKDDQSGETIADVYLEYREGQVTLYAWNEEDFDDEPTARIVLIENPNEALRRVREAHQAALTENNLVAQGAGTEVPA